MAEEPEDDRVGPIPRRLALRVLEGAFDDIDWDEVELLTLEEAMRRRTLRRRVRRSLWFAPRERIASFRHELRMRRQALARGWSDRDWWSLNQHLCQHLGELMLALVSDGRTLPAWVEGDGDEWRAEVRRQAEALLAFDMTDRRTTPDAAAALRWVADNLEDLWD